MTNIAALDPAPSGRRKADSLARLKTAARQLFVERGYDATRPQDIARAAGLGHGTFYLHYPDKRACFMAFVEDCRQEMRTHMRNERHAGTTLEERIAQTLNAIYDYSDSHPGVLRAATTDLQVIDAEGGESTPLLMQFGAEWADMIRFAAQSGTACASYDAHIIGQAIVGALHQTSLEAQRSGRDRTAMVENLTRFLAKALRPD
jgi:AcrR family transcriptional regulator